MRKTQFPEGGLKTHAIDQIGNWLIEAYRNPNTDELGIRVWNMKTGFCDYATRYEDGRVVWDFPERIPQRVKAIARTTYNNRSRKGHTNLSDYRRVL